MELTNDEESYVRIAGLETVVNILTLVDEGKIKVLTGSLNSKPAQKKVIRSFDMT